MKNIDLIISESEQENAEAYSRIDQISLFNQEKVLNAFKACRIALRHFSGSSGYGYEDEGKFVLSALFAKAFGAEAGIVSPLLASGTHAIATALFGLLRPNDTMFSVTGMPYDTLVPVIAGNNIGSLKDFSVNFIKADLLPGGEVDFDSVKEILTAKNPKVVFLQRSRGYTWRNSLSIDKIKELIDITRRLSPDSIIVVDNCYGEFTECKEPSDVGTDVIIGSLIKNPGGGIASTGAYICGKKEYTDLISGRLTAPGVGTEVGSYTPGYREYFQGLFLAPHVTAQALKGALLFSSVFTKLGYVTLPQKNAKQSDIICSIRFKSKDELVKFCCAIQSVSPVDSFAMPEAWDMPGYSDKVIMAAGTFIQGASIELSADAPIRPPYTLYVQGGLTYEHIKIAVKETLKSLI